MYTQDLRIYENPVDMVACAWHSRLLFVKEYYSLNSLRGYKHLDCFGLDVWNLSTGTCLNYLPFGQYGELKQLEVRGSLLAFINNAQSYIFLDIIFYY